MEGSAPTDAAAAVLAGAPSPGPGPSSRRSSNGSGSGSAAGSPPAPAARRRSRPVLAYDAPIYKSDEFRIKCAAASSRERGARRSACHARPLVRLGVPAFVRTGVGTPAPSRRGAPPTPRPAPPPPRASQLLQGVVLQQAHAPRLEALPLPAPRRAQPAARPRRRALRGRDVPARPQRRALPLRRRVQQGAGRAGRAVRPCGPRCTRRTLTPWRLLIQQAHDASRLRLPRNRLSSCPGDPASCPIPSPPPPTVPQPLRALPPPPEVPHAAVRPGHRLQALG
jgi:hypothetical protein